MLIFDPYKKIKDVTVRKKFKNFLFKKIIAKFFSDRDCGLLFF